MIETAIAVATSPIAARVTWQGMLDAKEQHLQAC